MPNLSDYSIKELKSEIIRQEREIALNNDLAPKPLKSSDYTPLVELCTAYIFDLTEKRWADEDFPHYIYETALICVFGKDVFTYVNKITRS